MSGGGASVGGGGGGFSPGAGLTLPPLEGLPRARVTCAIKKAISQTIRECRADEGAFEAHAAYCGQLQDERRRAGNELRAALAASRGLRSPGGGETVGRGERWAAVLCRKRQRDDERASGRARDAARRDATLRNAQWVRARHWLAHAVVALSVLRLREPLARGAAAFAGDAAAASPQQAAVLGAVDRLAEGAAARRASRRATRAQAASAAGSSAATATAAAASAAAAEAEVAGGGGDGSIHPEKARLRMARLRMAEAYRAQLDEGQLRAVTVLAGHLWAWWRRCLPRRSSDAADVVRAFLDGMRSIEAAPKALGRYLSMVKAAQRHVRAYVRVRAARLELLARQWEAAEEAARREAEQVRRTDAQRLLAKYHVASLDALLTGAGGGGGARTGHAGVRGPRRRGGGDEAPRRRVDKEDYAVLVRLKKRLPQVPRELYMPLLEQELMAHKRAYLSEQREWQRDTVVELLRRQHETKLRDIMGSDARLMGDEAGGGGGGCGGGGDAGGRTSSRPEPRRPTVRCLMRPERLQELLAQCQRSVEDQIAAKMLTRLDKQGTGSSSGLLPPIH